MALKDITRRFSRCLPRQPHHLQNVVNGLQLRNMVFDTSVKEDIILTKYTEYNKFRFLIDTDLKAKKDENGSITFSDAQGGNAVFPLPKPFMTDSNIDPLSGEPQRSDSGSI